MTDIPFDRSIPQSPGEVAQISPLVRRVVAGNAGPFTFTGTCSYIVGQRDVVIIDPGPDDPAHIGRLQSAIAGERLHAILCTHTHRDHSPAARALHDATGAPIVGCAPHHAARALAQGEPNLLDAANDLAYRPDRILADGEHFDWGGLTLEAIATPGHTMNHLTFAFAAENALFSGDHVMAWSTSIVAPPDGAMGPYMASLEKLRQREERLYWPGHGGPVREPKSFVPMLLGHRRQREAAILARLKAGDRLIPEIVLQLYIGLDPALRGAAALSVFAHLEDLVARGLAKTEGDATLDSAYSV
ncbi:MBL fold metallo-hydrolase [Methylovirgula sp. 4M-Z18]|uniref:MBL fold metallo-hydrolase n=1 Tax=Methylovirgula sp. 4M-Z18 TaxID=2293567 RepID=UPI000E2F58CC|nr:MBL fold metallo-hydrolase [Methylovirgula sp. 4M-Z18]RFB81332.1 MBL fold metallo-hydrolase [Methylovirgula sp. 4M-Z18]